MIDDPDRTQSHVTPFGPVMSSTESVDASQGTPPPFPERIGKYHVLSELGKGGEGTVYLVLHPLTRRPLVLKLAHAAKDAGDPRARERLLEEGRTLAALDHPGLVRVVDLDFDFDDGRPFLVMEHIDGVTLERHAAERCPAPREAAQLVAELARILDWLHRGGLIHQDLKPRNVLVDRSGQPRLIDFGLARLRDAWSAGWDEPTGGTPRYMAPEQARGEAHRVGPASDIFALGGTLYFLLTGRPPFADRAAAAAVDYDQSALDRPAVPAPLARVVRKAMAAEPDDRYPTAEALARDLDAYLWRPVSAFRGGNLVPAAVLAVGLLIVLGAVSRFVLFPRGPTPAAVPTEPAAAPAPLKVEMFEVELFRRVPAARIGRIGTDVIQAREDDDVRLGVRLNGPAHVLLIALNPDGRVQLCVPGREDEPPPRVSELVYPPDAGFGLTDGAGVQAFLLVASRAPLPPFDAWKANGPPIPWKKAEGSGVWHYDGRRFEAAADRGTVRPLADLPLPLKDACEAIGMRPDVETIEALAFPVRPRPGSPPPAQGKAP